MSKRVLFLDDDRRRAAHFLAMVEGLDLDLTIVETADECIVRLGERAFDVVFLDHDLGGEIYCDSSRQDCGMEVVRWLGHNRASHGRFVVHTHNEIAGATMFIGLRGLGYDVVHATFGSAQFRSVVEALLGRSRGAKPRRSISEILRDYFRSLRLGR
jgi:CheY-like chemotaxis protein